MFLNLMRARNTILFHPGIVPVERDFQRRGLGFGAQFVIAAFLMAGSLGLVAAFGLAVTKGFILAFS